MYTTWAGVLEDRIARARKCIEHYTEKRQQHQDILLHRSYRATRKHRSRWYKWVCARGAYGALRVREKWEHPSGVTEHIDYTASEYWKRPRYTQAIADGWVKAGARWFRTGWSKSHPYGPGLPQRGRKSGISDAFCKYMDDRMNRAWATREKMEVAACSRAIAEYEREIERNRRMLHAMRDDFEATRSTRVKHRLPWSLRHLDHPGGEYMEDQLRRSFYATMRRKTDRELDMKAHIASERFEELLRMVGHVNRRIGELPASASLVGDDEWNAMRRHRDWLKKHEDRFHALWYMYYMERSRRRWAAEWDERDRRKALRSMTAPNRLLQKKEHDFFQMMAVPSSIVA